MRILEYVLWMLLPLQRAVRIVLLAVHATPRLVPSQLFLGQQQVFADIPKAKSVIRAGNLLP